MSQGAILWRGLRLRLRRVALKSHCGQLNSVTRLHIVRWRHFDDAASSSRLLPQRRVTQQVMTHWLPHVQSSLAPPSDRNAILRRLHQKQEVEAVPDAEDDDARHSILCAGMARDASQPRTQHWSPVAWLSCLSTLGWVMAFTTGEWQSWFCMFLGLPLPSMCAQSANNRRCPCRRT